MKYKTFRALVLSGAVLAAVGLGWAIHAGLKARAAAREAELSSPSDPAPITPPATAKREAEPSAAGVPLRPMDRRILDRAAQNISGDKVKDAFPGEPWKVNLYRDHGHAQVNRLKLDLDRDEKWDEKWTFEQGDRQEVKRAVAPADDERYTDEFRLREGQWVPKAR